MNRKNVLKKMEMNRLGFKTNKTNKTNEQNKPDDLKPGEVKPDELKLNENVNIPDKNINDTIKKLQEERAKQDRELQEQFSKKNKRQNEKAFNDYMIYPSYYENNDMAANVDELINNSIDNYDSKNISNITE